MKKTLLALAIASISASAFAVETTSQNSKPMFEFDPMHKEQFSVSGAWGVGGYYDTKTDALYDDWATALTVAVNYKNNRLVGYLEVDLEMNYSTDEVKTNAAGLGIQSGPATDVDKAWLGFDTGYGVLSFGWENDTALDKVDGAGDQTYEFGASAGDASDGFNVIKFQGSTSGFAYGISTSETSDDRTKADTAYNGYVGIEQSAFKVYAGYETRDDADYNVTSVSGNAKLSDALTIGANFWIDEGKTDLKDNTTNLEKIGYYLSAGYAVTDSVTLAAGYATNTTKEDGAADIDRSYVNVAAMYTHSDKIDMGLDIRQDLEVKQGEDEETYVFAAAYYRF
ncbi:porin [Vibrio mimicus]|uniref:porin n=1 Tax=Vibrio mimicus TaxID=674 RepID=UPI0011D5AF27|nr:porin [Vibrio mimicus]TXY47130.1 porin [Vibrio mimicus]